MGDGWTERRRRFVDEYLLDVNATQAAIRAGFAAKSAAARGSALLREPVVLAEISKRLEERAKRVEVNADTVLRELLLIATTDIGDAFDEHGRLRSLAKMSPSIRRALASIETEQTSGEELCTVTKVRWWDKPKALELLGKHLGLFAEKLEVTGKGGGPIVVDFGLDLTRARE